MSRNKRVKETVAFQKCMDSIVEVEVALDKIREELHNKESFTTHSAMMLSDARKAFNKLNTYLCKLPVD